ncbi:MAG: hypothetical protein M1825_001711 [Sarcosagium campestre]|nr:MAG: hypothetical protein M1825_001711 [Sarcosagium campestre]
MRLDGGRQGFGPFNSVRDFHSFLRDGIAASPGQYPQVNELVEMHENGQSSTCLTHGDLNSMNILVKEDDIVGIIDWDTVAAYNVNPYNDFWKDEVGKFLEEYPNALKMEQLKQQYFGAF